MEKFNPSSPEYEQVSDLAKPHRQNFEDVEGGGFIRKEAAENDAVLAEKAIELNKDRSLIEKITGKNKATAMDLAHEEALEMDKWGAEASDPDGINNKKYEMALNEHPEIGPLVREISRPDLPIDDMFKLSHEFNEKYARGNSGVITSNVKLNMQSDRTILLRLYDNGCMSIKCSRRD